MPIDLRDEQGRKRPTIARNCRLELRPPLSPSRPEVVDSLGCQQTFNAPDMLDTFLHQELALTMKAFGILFRNRGDAHNAADLRFTSPKRHQDSNQLFCVETIGF